MRKQMVLIVLVLLSVFLVFGSSLAWQGRMAGMGDPYGLTPDDSDFLIHPALIVGDKGFDFYSHLDFKYTGISKWDIDIDIPNPMLPWSESFDSAGDQFDYGALMGPVMDLGTGRIGIFLAYEGMNRDIEGDADYTYNFSVLPFPSTSADYNLESDIHNFSLRLIYGLPIDVNCLNVGAEVKISYIDENQRNELEDNAGVSFLNLVTTTLRNHFEANTLWFQVPYESDYWQADFKGSANGRICLDDMMPIDVTLSFGGGFIFAGDNEYKYEAEYPAPVSASPDLDADGDIGGFTLGGDLWVRVPVSDTLALPFLVGVHYNEKNRDGKGVLNGVVLDSDFDYEHKEESFVVDAGGGIDIKLSDSSRGTAGLFYTYLDCSDDVLITYDSPAPPPPPAIYEDSVPDYTEHRVTLKLGWETDLSSTTTFRTGFTTFYGFIEKEYEYQISFPPIPSSLLGQRDEVSMDGQQWGIAASIGGSFKMASVTLEPYINAGYRDLDLDGNIDVVTGSSGPLRGRTGYGDVEESREEWFVGGGLSILFGN
ncbi:MAG: hypothetical protein JRF06_06945 [Deltaproteobacteria bacterium]|nr:hypothetical protein [Deltaproteobacteria bacterium]